MLETFFHRVKLALTDQAIRNRILFVIAAFVAFRFLANIPIPGVNHIALENFFSNNQFFGLLNVFSGGGLANLSIVMLGVGPYITASIVMQVATIIFPALKRSSQDEGEAGRAKFVSWTRLLSVPLAAFQAIAFLFLLKSQGVLLALSPIALVANILLVIAGSILLMWIGELVTEFGIGNGVSLIIFAGIVAGLPAALSQSLFAASVAQIPAYLGLTLLALAMTYIVVVVSDAERTIPIAYARAVRGAALSQGAATYLPIRLLQAGVIPIIFALSFILLPQFLFTGLATFGIGGMTTLATGYTAFLSNPWYYGAAYFVLVVVFTYFYTSITFEPERVAENLQKSGAFVPGVRPGHETETYIGNVVNRITLPGAVFLGLLAVAPSVVQGLTGIATLLIGGTALLIAVQVALDLARKLEAQVSLREY